MAKIRLREELVPEAAALALVGGFLDVYTYITRGGVFANAQTGNVVLFGIRAGNGDWSAAWTNLPPIGAFLLGMVTVEALARLRQVWWLRRPTRIVLVVECVVFGVIGLTHLPDVVATVVITWAATLQMATFRHVRESTYATTFTTANLRSLVSNLTSWLVDHDAGAARQAQALGALVVSFAVGALLGGLATDALHDRAVLLTLPVLLAVLVSVVVGTRFRDVTPVFPDVEGATGRSGSDSVG